MFKAIMKIFHSNKIHLGRFYERAILSNTNRILVVV
jgi:hypothetical protein